VDADEHNVNYRVSGAPPQELKTCRTGICVLHPAHLAGQPVQIRHDDGRTTDDRFPERIKPDWPFRDVVGMRHPIGPGLGVDLTLAGIVFETEDQRNWSDASYKTYCRPQHQPFPYVIPAGETVDHRVTVRPAEAPFSWARVILPGAATRPRKRGLVLAEAPLSGDELARIAAWPLDFLAVDLRRGPVPKSASALPFPLVLIVPRDASASEVRAEVEAKEVEEIILAGASPEPSAEPWRQAFGVPVVRASTDNFTELNRERPPAESADGFGFAANPQVHAFDNRSIFETVDTYPELVASARALGYRRVSVGPVTWEPRGWRTRPADPRQRTDVGARWFRAVDTKLADADRVIYLETHGDRGVLGSAPLEEWVRSWRA